MNPNLIIRKHATKPVFPPPWAQTLPAHISPTAAKSYLLKETKTPQVIRVQSPPVDDHRKRRVTALLETAVEGIASSRHHPQPGMHCSWCQYRNECRAWLPGMTMEEVRRAA